MGLSADIDALAPATHDRIFDAVLAMRCWRDLDPATPATNTALPKGWAIGIAESRDLVRWTKAGELLPAQDCDRLGLCAPEAIVLDSKPIPFTLTTRHPNGAITSQQAAYHLLGVHGYPAGRGSGRPWRVFVAGGADVGERSGRHSNFCRNTGFSAIKTRPSENRHQIAGTSLTFPVSRAARSGPKIA